MASPNLSLDLADAQKLLLTLDNTSAKKLEAEGIHGPSDQVNPWRQLHVR